MEQVAVRFGVWIGVLAAVLVTAGYVIWHLRRHLLTDEDDGEDDADEAPLYTTAEVERLKSEGEIDEAQYQQLKAEALEAAKRRAAKAGKARNKKQGLFG
jgi:hypothetical protein